MATPDDYRRAEGADAEDPPERHPCNYCRGTGEQVISGCYALAVKTGGAFGMEGCRWCDGTGLLPLPRRTNPGTPRRFRVPDVPTDDRREQRINAEPSGLMVAMAMLAVVIVAVLVGVWSGELGR